MLLALLYLLYYWLALSLFSVFGIPNSLHEMYMAAVSTAATLNRDDPALLLLSSGIDLSSTAI